jgi:hypothetical protein
MALTSNIDKLNCNLSWERSKNGFINTRARAQRKIGLLPARAPGRPLAVAGAGSQTASRIIMACSIESSIVQTQIADYSMHGLRYKPPPSPKAISKAWHWRAIADWTSHSGLRIRNRHVGQYHSTMAQPRSSLISVRVRSRHLGGVVVPEGLFCHREE